jgi:hypothetical protein
VDIDARVVERWRPVDERPEVLTETLSWQPLADQPPLVSGRLGGGCGPDVRERARRRA